MDFSTLYEQLKKRRVIRAAIVYLALVWVALQVADLFANAGVISATLVRGLLLAAIIGFPIVIVVSWLYDVPWRSRKSLSVAGDVVVILSIVIAASLLALRQWTASFTAPTIAVMPFVATDTRPDTPKLGDHLSKRLRNALSLNAGLIVLETHSSHDEVLVDLPAADVASKLNADLLIRGTVNQDDNRVRLTVQLVSAGGDVLWIEQFEDRLVDLMPLQSSVLNDLWPLLPLPEEDLPALREIVASCDYPETESAVRALIAPDSIDAVSVELESADRRGLLFLSRARLHAAGIESAPGTRRPVLQRLAMNDLDNAANECPNYPQVRLDRLHLSQAAVLEIEAGRSTLEEFPNDALLHVQAARLAADNGDLELAKSLANRSSQLDPLNPSIIGQAEQLLGQPSTQ